MTECRATTLRAMSHDWQSRLVVGRREFKYSGAVWPKRNQPQPGRLANLRFCPRATPLARRSAKCCSWPSTAAPIVRRRVRYLRSFCRAALWSSGQFLTHSVIPPPSIAALRKDYSITSSASACILSGTVRPRALAVFRFMMSSNLVGCSTGISPGFVPRRILSTKSAARWNRAG
jgi:hypothetical protein